ncbi:MAG TPA: DUF222 domain-containing protein [Mycobacteriales bacterium]|nr:DUF222 domain-containing protein [Mycobacteriales bacterium]
MTSTANDDPVAEAIAALASGVAAVADMPLQRRDALGQSGAYAEVETLRRRLEFTQLQLLRELQDAGVAATLGAPSMVALRQGLIRISPSEASARVRASEALGSGRSLTQQPIPPRLPIAADAARQGAIGAEHVQVIVRILHRLPTDIDPATRTSAEQTMTDNARQFDPRTLSRIGVHLLHRLAPKDPEPKENERHRGLIFRGDVPGLTAIHGLCTDAVAAIIQSALDPLSAPLPESGGTKDLRTAAQRRMDALEELARRALTSGDLPSQGGERPHVNIIVRPGTTTAELPWVGPVHLDQISWMLCDSIVTPIELDEHGVPQRIGDPTRSIPMWLRRSVIARDRGCSFPGCDRPSTWSDVHHIHEWARGGTHQRDNLTVLCGHHHQLIHRAHWQIRMIDGTPHYVPPRWIDPDQVPRRNHLHHAPTRNQPLRT